MPDKKLTIVVAALLVTVFLLLLVILWGTAKQSGPISQLQKDKITPSYPTATPEAYTAPVFENEEVVSQILSYIQTQKRPDGFYDYIFQLKDSQTKGLEKSYPTTNAWTALAFASGYKVFNEGKYIDLADADIEALYTYCQQNKSQCLWVLWQLDKISDFVKSDLARSLYLQLGDELMVTSQKDDLMLLSIEVRELAQLYRLTNDNRFLTEAENRYASAKENFTKQPIVYQTGESVFPHHACWFTLAALELSQITQNNQESADARNFIDQAAIEQNFDKFQYPVEVMPCLETYFVLSQTYSNSYYGSFQTLMDKFSNKAFDGAGKNLLYGKGGIIFDLKGNKNSREGNLVNLTDSAYMAYLLSL